MCYGCSRVENRTTNSSFLDEMHKSPVTAGLYILQAACLSVLIFTVWPSRTRFLLGEGAAERKTKRNKRFCLHQQMSLRFKSPHPTRVNTWPALSRPVLEQSRDHLLRQLHLLHIRRLDVDSFCRATRVLCATLAAATYYQTKKAAGCVL